MMARILCALLVFSMGLAGTMAQAAPAKKPASTAKSAKAAKAVPAEKPAAAAEAPAAPASGSTQTDVIGSKEAPSVFNVVPWKDKEATLPKREVSTSILRETMQPLDRDVLRREIYLQQTLSQQ